MARKINKEEVNCSSLGQVGRSRRRRTPSNTNLLIYPSLDTETRQNRLAKMRFQLLSSLLPLVGLSLGQLQPNFTSSTGVNIYNPADFFDTTGPWSLMSQAGDTLYIAGQSCPCLLVARPCFGAQRTRVSSRAHHPRAKDERHAAIKKRVSLTDAGGQ